MKVSRKGNVLIIAPWHEILHAALSYKEVQRDSFSGTYKTSEVSLYDLQVSEDGKNYAVTFGGLLQKVLTHCQREGIPVELSDSQPTLPDPDWSKLESLREIQGDVIAKITASHRGVIDCPTAFGKSFLIVQLCRIHPKLRILVVSPRREVVRSLYARLDDAGVERVSLCDGAHRFLPDSSVVVCTSGSLHKIDVDWPEMLLFDEVHGAAGALVYEKLSKFTWSRMFGFSASPTGRADNADLVVEALFGPTLCSVSYAEAEQKNLVAPIEVRMVRVEGYVRNYDRDFMRQRFGYWKNQERNAKIRQIARSFPEDTQILLFTATVEHALHLRRLLPEYAIVHSGISKDKLETFSDKGLLDERDENLLHPDISDIREKFRKNELKKVIATTVWKEGVDFPNLSVLIRADGMPGKIPSIQISGRLSRVVDGKTSGLLIDFIDDFGQPYLRRSLLRRKEYVNKGWKVNDWEPSCG